MNTKFLFKYLKKLPGKFFLPIIAAIWVLGIGLRWLSISFCIVLTIVVIVIWLLYILQGWIRSKGKGKEVEVVPELAEFEEKLIASTKTAKNVPWYLVIGPSDCGKTSLLRNSDLDFSYIDSSHDIEQGIDKTKNCDLFYTRQGIVLDTTGRYVTLGKEAQVRTEWLGLLALLKRHRKARPIEGLIVAVDIERLLQDRESVIKDEAKMIREAITDAISNLEITFPVYIVFTKCDVIYGFSQFFDGMDSAERAQVWGATLSGSQLEDPQAAFRTECGALFQSLCAHRLAKLGSATGGSGSAIYAFPLEFDAVCQKLAPFVDELFHVVSDEKPVFRGFYFTSGAQGGSPPIDFPLKDVAKSLSAQPLSLSAPPLEDKGKEGTHFVRELFQRVIFPDHGLHGPTTEAERRKTRMRLTLFGIGIAAILTLGIIFGVSYAKNKKLMSNTEIAAVSVKSISSSTDPVKELERFEELRKDIVKLEKTKLFSLPWRGHRNDVAYAARKIYLSKKFGSTAGADGKFTRRVEILIKVFKFDAGKLEPIEKAPITAVIAGKKDKILNTNKDGIARLRMSVKDAKINVTLSTDYELTGYEAQREQVYQIQPGEGVGLKSSSNIQFIFSKSGRFITVHCVDQFGENLSGVPVSVIEQADESKRYGPVDSNEKGIAQIGLEAQEGSVLLVYYGDSPASYPEEEPDTVTIKAGESRYKLDKRLRRKLNISVTAFMKSETESSQPPKPGVTVSVGGIALGQTGNDGSWSGPSETVPTRQNVTATPKPDDLAVESTASGYIITLEYTIREKPKVDETPAVVEPTVEPEPLPVIKLDESIPGDIEVWVYLKPEDNGLLDASKEIDRMEFDSDGKRIRLVRVDATRGKGGDLEIPRVAENHQLQLWHPDYWPQTVQWSQTSQPIQMIDIKLERSLKDFGKVQRDGADHYSLTGRKYYDSRNYAQSIRDYGNAIRLSPRMAYYLDLAWAYHDSAQADASLRRAKTGIALKLTDDPEANEQLLKQQLQEILDMLE